MTDQIHVWLAPHIHMAQIGADVVVLDIQGDAYTCLAGGAEHLQPIGDGQIRVSHRAVLDDLVRTGWASLSADILGRRPIIRPRQSWPSRPVNAGLSVAPVGLQILTSTTWFNRQTLPDILEAARRLRPIKPPRKSAQAIIDQTVSAFEEARPWLPLQGVCLQRSFALLGCLARRGVAVDWVFGVRTWPFAAHCWLQRDDAVIADDLDRVQSFTPILVV